MFKWLFKIKKKRARAAYMFFYRDELIKVKEYVTARRQGYAFNEDDDLQRMMKEGSRLGEMKGALDIMTELDLFA